MGKKDKFDKMDELMREEYNRRAQEIEDNLSDDGSFDPDRIDSKALRLRIQRRIEEREEEKAEAKRVRLYRLEKVAGIFLVTFAGIFLVSMTSEANRMRLGDTIRYLTGNEVIVWVGGNENKKNIENDEEEILAYQKIKEEIGIPVPFIRYRPDIKRTFSYDFVHEDAMVTLKYQFGDINLNLTMVNKNRTDVSGMAFHGKKIKEVDVMGGFLTIPVQKVKDMEDVKSSFSAQWEYEDGYYQLSGKAGEKEFIEIVENIRY